MDAIAGMAMNIYLTEDKDCRLSATVECILLLLNTSYTMDANEMQRRRQVKDVRFTADAKGLRELSKTFAEWATDAEALESTHNREGDER